MRASAASAVEEDLLVPPDAPLFPAGGAARDAPLAAAPARFPLVVLSHGTGGSALQLAWLGTRLAARGYVAAAVDHPGNNAVDGYTPQGFMLRWERARDLSAVLDGVLADATFGARVDAGRIGAAGFSLGGYTVLLLAGARTDRGAFERWCAAPKHRAICAGPPELPDAAARFAEIARDDPGARLDVLEGAGHYTFLAVPTERAREALPALAVDPPGVERDAVHARAAAMAAEFLDAALR